MLSRTGLSLSDMGMTAKVIEDEEVELGKLNSGAAQSEELGEYQRRQVEALEGLKGIMENARLNKMRDVVLIEHKNQEGSGA
jgi:hypothetical protein